MHTLITGLGLVSSVGRDAVTACASLRASLRRARPLSGLDVLGDDLMPEAIFGHPLAGFTDGFFLLGRWRRLASGALSDLVESAALPPPRDGHFWSRTGLIAVTSVLDERIGVEEPPSLEVVKREYLRPLLPSLGELPSELVDVVSVGHPGMLFSAERARAWMGAGRCDRVIILAVDSLVDTLPLGWLAEADRLKSADNPTGLEPGEAGCCVLLESESAALRRKGLQLAKLGVVALEQEAANYDSETRSQGVALGSVMEQCLAGMDVAVPFAGDLIVDLNGEEWRALEFGNALARLGASKLSSHVRMLLPCESLGDTGAASAAIAFCMASRAFARDYGRREGAMVVSSTEHGVVGAALLHPLLHASRT